MNTSHHRQKKKGENGNVLFLILIAVALFAALSYAVTQSTRSGGGDASREKSLVSSAGVTQYPASIKTAIVRMIVSNGVTANELLFKKPSGFADLSTAALQKRGVFYPTGGGASYSDGPGDVSDDGLAKAWTFNATNEVKNIGTSAPSTSVTTATADIIAFLPDMSESVCKKIHEQLGLGSTVNTSLTSVDIATNMDAHANADNIPASPGGDIITSATLDGQPQGCFQKAAGNLVYYHVLVER